jgi:hypothetical protein
MGPRFHETPSLHLTFGMEHGCQTTVEALLHHAIETHAASGGMGAKMAIPSRDCPMAAGRDIPWKDVLHFAVAEVARRQDMCKKGSSKNICILRQSVPIQPGFKELALSRSQGSSLAHGDEAVKGTLLEALSVVHALVEPDHLARFVWRLEGGDGESIRTFCHPFISRQSTAPCPDALAQVDKRALRSYASDLRDFASKHFNVIQQQFEVHVQRMRLATWNEEDELLKLVGQWASLETHTWLPKVFQPMYNLVRFDLVQRLQASSNGLLGRERDNGFHRFGLLHFFSRSSSGDVGMSPRSKSGNTLGC